MRLIEVTPGPESWQSTLRFSYDPIILAQVKAMPGMRWEPKSKTWFGDRTAVDILCNDLVTNRLAKIVKYDVTYPAAQGLPMPDLADWLYSFQADGVKWLRDMLIEEGAALLCDGMGLGKTTEAIFAADCVSAKSVLVICPAVAQTTWIRELRKINPSAEFTITSWNKFALKPAEGTFDLVILDEIHYAANGRSKRSKAVRTWLESHPSVMKLGLSGTPMTARPKDLWHCLDLLWPGRFGTFFSFTKKYSAGAYVTIKGLENPVWQCMGASNLEELGQRLNACMLRRTKKDVKEQLPNRVRICIDVEMPVKAKKNIALAAKLLNQVDNNTAKIQQILSNVEEYKTKAALELAEDVIQQGRKPLLLTTRKETAKVLSEKLEASCVTGEDSPNQRAQILQGSDVGCATIYSITTGIDLVHFDTIIFCGLDWIPSTLLQAEARIDRLSQTAEEIVIYYLIGLGTFDEIVRARVIERLTHYEKVLGNEETGLEKGLNSKSDEQLLEELCQNI